MAPPNGSVRGRKAGTGLYRPKPALPLTYAQRKAAAAARDASVASSTASSATELHSPSSQATSTQPDVKTDTRQATEVSRGVPNAATSHDETCELPPTSERSTNDLDSTNGRAFIGKLKSSLYLPHIVFASVHLTRLCPVRNGPRCTQSIRRDDE